ncbi:hypothetical protein MTO96_026220 [Rhipicephalus appendiculatus]
MAASDDTCKGFVRGVDIDEQQLAAMNINQRNSKAMEVHRIKETTTVVILFSGLKAQEGLTSRDSSAAPPPRMRSSLPAVGRRHSRSKGCSRSCGRSCSKGRSRSRLHFQEAPITWTDRAKPKQAQQPAQVTHAALPEQKKYPRIAFILQENASLKAQLQQMRVEFEALKNSAQAPTRPSSAEAQPVKRRIGAEGEVAAASDSDVLGAIRDSQKRLRGKRNALTSSRVKSQ